MKPDSKQSAGDAPQAAPASLRLAKELSKYEQEERRRLGLPAQKKAQWVDRLHERFGREERATATILMFGLSRNHDLTIAAAVRSLGHRVQVLDVPDEAAHTMGRAYCDRGMCNPTYFMVGHLLRFLFRLRDEEGLTSQEIVKRYLLVTPNGCGPCRYTLYINEFRKALRDSGFEGFRVLLFNQRLIERQSGPDSGLQIDGRLMFTLVRAIIVADILNVLTWRIRPYELEPGTTDAAVARCRERLMDALESRHGLLAALWNVRRELKGVAVDRTRIKPKVGIIGEIWAQTTEGDGNYRLQQFLETEGAEVEAQTLIAWILLLQWELVYDTSLRAGLQDARVARDTVSPVRTWFKLAVVLMLVGVIHLTVRGFARLAGLRGFKLPRLRKLARKAHPFYDVTMRGGEMFSEVAKLMDYAEHGSAHLVVSVKPFGCMPSSAVSDGVQSLVGERYPELDFLAVETTGDSAVNLYSRLQMQLFKARRRAQLESAAALAQRHATVEDMVGYLRRHPCLTGALHRSPAGGPCTASNLFREIGRRPGFRLMLGWHHLWATLGRWRSGA